MHRAAFVVLGISLLAVHFDLCAAGDGQGAEAQQAAAPQGSSREDMHRQALSSDSDASQPDMDLQKALKIVSKHYISRNITWITCSLMFYACVMREPSGLPLTACLLAHIARPGV